MELRHDKKLLVNLLYSSSGYSLFIVCIFTCVCVCVRETMSQILVTAIHIDSTLFLYIIIVLI